MIKPLRLPVCPHASRLLIVMLVAGLGFSLLSACQPERESLRYQQQARTAIFAGDPAAAARAYERAAQEDPTSWKSWMGLGKMRLELNEPEAARIALERAIALRPRDPQATPEMLDMLAEAFYQQENEEQMYRFLTWMVSNYKASEDFRRQGVYLTRMGDVDNARVALAKALRFADEDDAAVYLAIADYYIVVNDSPRAIEALRYAHYLDPDSEDVARRFRQLGIVPGPTQRQVPPPRPVLEL